MSGDGAPRSRASHSASAAGAADPLGLTGRRSLVTGGAAGLGAAAARRLAATGATGAVIDTSEAIEPPDGWPALRADVRDEPALAAAIDRAAAELGGLDLVIAAAGVVPGWQPLGKLDLDDFDRVMAINTRGVAATLKHCSHHLRSGATVTVIASINAWRGDPHIAAYVASKHAVLGLVRSAALALGPRGIRVNAIAPGPVATPALLGRMATREAGGGLTVAEALADAAGATALGRLVTVDEVTDVMLFLSAGLSAGVTGQMLGVDAGLL